ncbi:MAG TPA: hypothetical protein DGT23_30825 [Micromonosporaceae bacterium]|nr:hypothetical protein [Micromonosporaceae bacterium]
MGSVTGGSDPHRASLRAWLCSDSTGMQAKMTEAAITQLNAVPKDIDLQWTFVSCGGAAGSTYCTYRNTFGSDLIFRVPSESPQKVTEVKFDRTVFNTDAKQYTSHFVEAWISGNVQRMQALSSPAIVSFAATHSAPATPFTVTLSPSEVWIFEVTSSGADYRFVLKNQLGRSNAITELHTL